MNSTWAILATWKPADASDMRSGRDQSEYQTEVLHVILSDAKYKREQLTVNQGSVSNLALLADPAESPSQERLLTLVLELRHGPACA